MKRKILKFIYGQIVLAFAAATAAVAWFVFYPAVPNTAASTRGFQEMTGLSPSEVSEIYYDSSSDFHGDYSKYLRFTYPTEQWLERFLSRRGDLSPATTLRCSTPGSSWWDPARVCQLSEYYEQRQRMPCMAMAIDRQQRHVYLCYYTF